MIGQLLVDIFLSLSPGSTRRSRLETTRDLFYKTPSWQLQAEAPRSQHPSADSPDSREKEWKTATEATEFLMDKMKPSDDAFEHMKEFLSDNQTSQVWKELVVRGAKEKTHQVYAIHLVVHLKGGALMVRACMKTKVFESALAMESWLGANGGLDMAATEMLGPAAHGAASAQQSGPHVATADEEVPHVG